MVFKRCFKAAALNHLVMLKASSKSCVDSIGAHMNIINNQDTSFIITNVPERTSLSPLIIKKGIKRDADQFNNV